MPDWTSFVSAFVKVVCFLCFAIFVMIISTAGSYILWQKYSTLGFVLSLAMCFDISVRGSCPPPGPRLVPWNSEVGRYQFCA